MLYTDVFIKVFKRFLFVAQMLVKLHCYINNPYKNGERNLQACECFDILFGFLNPSHNIWRHDKTVCATQYYYVVKTFDKR